MKTVSMWSPQQLAREAYAHARNAGRRVISRTAEPGAALEIAGDGITEWLARGDAALEPPEQPPATISKVQELSDH